MNFIGIFPKQSLFEKLKPHFSFPMTSDSESSLNSTDEKEYNEESTEAPETPHTSDLDFVVNDSEIDDSYASFVPSETSASYTSASSSTQSSGLSSFATQSSGRSSFPSESTSNISGDDEDIDFGGFYTDNLLLPGEGQQEQIQEIDNRYNPVDSGTTESDDSDVVFIERRKID